MKFKTLACIPFILLALTFGCGDDDDHHYSPPVITDIESPTENQNPITPWNYDTDGIAEDVEVSGNYAYVADTHKGLKIIDISDPSTPVLAGKYTDEYGHATSWDVAISGNYAYLAEGSDGLKIVDVFDPSSPKLSGHYETKSFCEGIDVSENYAYVACRGDGLLIFDVSDPANPIFTGQYDTDDPGALASGVTVSGNYAYLADGSPNLKIIDISDPFSPKLAVNSDFPDALNVVIDGNYLYSCGGVTLEIIDITVPSSPVHVGRYVSSGVNPEGIAVSGDLAFVTRWNDGLLIIDISDRSDPKLLSKFETTNGGLGLGVTVSGDYAYFAAGSEGLFIIDISSL